MSDTIEYRETTMEMTAVYSTSQGNPPGGKLEGLFVSHVRAEQFARTFRSLTSDGFVREVAVTVSEEAPQSGADRWAAAWAELQQIAEGASRCEHGQTSRHALGVPHEMDSFPLYFCQGPA